MIVPSDPTTIPDSCYVLGFAFAAGSIQPTPWWSCSFHNYMGISQPIAPLGRCTTTTMTYALRSTRPLSMMLLWANATALSIDYNCWCDGANTSFTFTAGRDVRVCPTWRFVYSLKLGVFAGNPLPNAHPVYHVLHRVVVRR